MNKRGHITDKEEWDIANKGRVEGVEGQTCPAAAILASVCIYFRVTRLENLKAGRVKLRWEEP